MQAWANSIEGKTAGVVQFFLTSGKEVEQGYKACASLSKLFSRYGGKRLETAYERATAYTSIPTVRNISAILKNGQDRAPAMTDAQASEPSSCYGTTRGADYFSKGGDSE